MARSHFRYIVNDTAGNVVENGRSYLMVAGTTTGVTDVWSAASAGTALPTAVPPGGSTACPYLDSNNQGEIECWLDDPQAVTVRNTSKSGASYYPSAPTSLLPDWQYFDETVDVYPPVARLAGIPRNVEEYGALSGTGSNATAGLQAAINDGPGVVFIPGDSSVVWMTDTLTPANNVVIVTDATVRLRTSQVHVFLASTVKTGFGFIGGVYDGAYRETSAGTCMRFIDCTDFFLDRVTLINAGSIGGLDAQECLRFWLRNCKANNNGAGGANVGAGFYLREKTAGTGCKDFQLIGCTADSNGLGVGLDGTGLHLSGSATSGQVVGFRGTNNTRYGLKNQAKGRMTFSDILTYGNQRGFSHSGAKHASVSNLTTESNTDIGYWVDAASEDIRSDNIRSRNNTAQGMQISANAKRISTVNYFAESNGGKGIDDRGGEDHQYHGVTIIDSGSASPNTTDAVYFEQLDGLILNGVKVRDTRATTARMVYPLNLNTGVTNAKVSNFESTNTQQTTINGAGLATYSNVSISGNRYETSRLSFIKQTGGDYVTNRANNTAWFTVDAALDRVVAAIAGDTILVGISACWANEGLTGLLDVATIVSSSPVHYIGASGGTGDFGIEAWRGPSGVTMPIAGAVPYTVVSGDISGGTVTLELVNRNGTSGANKTLHASGTEPLIFWAQNIGLVS